MGLGYGRLAVDVLMDDGFTNMQTSDVFFSYVLFFPFGLLASDFPTYISSHFVVSQLRNKTIFG